MTTVIVLLFVMILILLSAAVLSGVRVLAWIAIGLALLTFLLFLVGPIRIG